MPAILIDNIDNDYCKMRATADEIVKHYKENMGEYSALKTYNARNDVFEDIEPGAFLKSAKFGEYDFHLYLSEYGNTIHIII